MSDAQLTRLICAEMQRFTGRQYEIAFNQLDTRSLQELLRFLLDAEYAHEVPRSATQLGGLRRADHEVKSSAV
jgi:hypothetical protein